ncbi:Agamous-like MADS-box protein AGL18 [Raphanus sativus]|uniref:Agamous-like MADS-box protein AGL18 n=1 Tax=Raphanus sativus TaxID=3726 RepID=A0A6J0JVT2_RAPSA|nr:agamous-like MADS-box protein AGL18 [Raphanus sativus]KAJ4890811.1 Agamous-like MADS-box protein AGL18 [Raphanus sativus]
MKKANELSILCDAKVGDIVFSSTGMVYYFSSEGMEHILSKYGYSAATSGHRQKEEQQLLLCSSQDNGDLLWTDESLTSELERLQLAIEKIKGKEFEGMSSFLLRSKGEEDKEHSLFKRFCFKTSLFHFILLP